MKMKKGFTLAEVLVTLGIIGVVAALTIPSLNANVSQQKIGPALSKAVNTLENANRRSLVETESTSFSGSDYLSAINPYINGSIYTKASGNYTADNYTSGNVTLGTSVLVTKDGIGYYNGGTASVNSVSSDKYSKDYFKIYVDINGPNASPNTLGKDIFYFPVDNVGNVIPYGGMMWKGYSGEDIKWNAGADSCVTGNISTGQACAGAVADNGWKAAYK